MATVNSEALHELDLHIARMQALLAQARASMDSCQPATAAYGRASADVKHYKETLEDLHYRRRRLARFEGTGWGDL